MVINRFGCLTLLCLVGSAPACRKNGEGEAAAPPLQSPAPVPRSSELTMEDVEIPLRVSSSDSSAEIRGKARVARLKLGAGKRGGIMKALSPSARGEGTEVTTEGDDLRILADLPSGVKTLLPLDTVEFRGLRVRTQTGTLLLECTHALVGPNGVWELRSATVVGGSFLSLAQLSFAPDGAVQLERRK